MVRAPCLIAFLLTCGLLAVSPLYDPLGEVIGSPSSTLFQQSMADAMQGVEGTVLVVSVDTGDVVSHRMDASARRVGSPGSIVKPFTLLALVEEGVVAEVTTAFCPRIVRVGGRNPDCTHPVESEAIDAWGSRGSM